MATKLNDKYLNGFVGEHEYAGIAEEVKLAHKALHDGTCLGNDFIGWLNLPTDYDKEEFARIKAAAEKIKKNTDVFVVIGIGGSYLGARAAIEFLTSQNYNLTCKDTPQIFFTGNSISSSALAELIELCEGKDVSVNMISKSGTTTEPAIAFRVFRELLENKYGKEGAKERIFCTTDKARGTLKALADKEGYETFVVPDDVGGRFSVLTAVGLLPIAVSGLLQVRRYPQPALPQGQNYGDHGFLRACLHYDVRVVQAAVRRERGQGQEGHFPRKRCILYRPALFGTVHPGRQTHYV